MEFDFIDIDAFVLESAINVFEAHMNYANKMNLIRDISNNVTIPESLYNKLNDMISDKVVMEASVDTGKTVSTPSKFFTYQCDFKTHNPSIAKSNYRLAEYMISAFEASQQAKKQNNEPNNPLEDLLIKRTPLMNKLIGALYNGKIEAVYKLINLLKRDTRGVSFVQVDKISPFNGTQNRQGEITGKDTSVKFKFDLPVRPLSKIDFEKCEYLSKIKNKQKEQNAVKAAEGTRSEKFLSLAEEIRDIRAKAPYGMNTTDSEANKHLIEDTCYTDKKENRKMSYHEFALHLIKSTKNTEDTNRMVDSIEKDHNISSDFAVDEGANHDHMVALGKQFGFIKITGEN